MRTLSGDDPVHPLAAHRAREAHEWARLAWLSCDLRLRSSGITGPFRFRQSKGILTHSATENVRHSIVGLLKAHEYVSTPVATVNELHAAAQTSRFAAVLAYVEPAMRRAPSFGKYLELVSQPLPLIVFPGVSIRSNQADVAAAAYRMTSPPWRRYLPV